MGEGDRDHGAGADPEPAADLDAAPAHPNDPAFSAPLDGGVVDAPDDEYFGEDAATLGDRLAAARQRAGLTQTELALRLGVGKKVISAWENDRSEPRANRLSLLAGLLGVSVSWLLTGAGEGVEAPEAVPSAAAPSRVEVVIAVPDLAAARGFFVDTLGAHPLEAVEGAAAFGLFSHRVMTRLVEVDAKAEPGAAAQGAGSEAGEVGPDGAPLPHVRLHLEWDAWSALIERLRAQGAVFALEPAIHDVGAPSEWGVCALRDPSGFAWVFAARRALDMSGP